MSVNSNAQLVNFLDGFLRQMDNQGPRKHQKVGAHAFWDTLRSKKSTTSAEKGHFAYEFLKKWGHMPTVPLDSYVHVDN